MDISSVAGLDDENDLYCHPDHGEPRAIVNACRNAALLKASGSEVRTRALRPKYCTLGIGAPYQNAARINLGVIHPLALIP